MSVMNNGGPFKGSFGYGQSAIYHARDPLHNRIFTTPTGESIYNRDCIHRVVIQINVKKPNTKIS